MGRTLGPFTDVSTARVDGAYEIYEGRDDEDRDVEILTLGATSSKDPARRALLSDTVAWAHATRGPADAPILSADLHAEEPYVVTLQQSGFRGVERLLERMLAMGPSTGPLTAPVGQHTGQLPVVGNHTDPHGIPRVTSAPPSGSPVVPASPMNSYSTRFKRSSPGWLVPVVIVLALLIVSTGGFLVFSGMTEGSDDAHQKQSESDNQKDESTGEDGPSSALKSPQWRDDSKQVAVVSDEHFGSGQGEVIKTAGWPFAFKVANGVSCEADEKIARCESQDTSPDEAITVTVAFEDCPGDCDAQQRDKLRTDWEPENNSFALDDSTDVAYDYESATNQIEMRHLFMPVFNKELVGQNVQVIATISGPAAVQTDINRIINGIRTQTP